MPIVRLDIGVFPWHGTIEISFLLSSDLADDLAPDDVAAWPYYNFVNSYQGGWPEAEPLLKRMREIWGKDMKMSEQFYRAVAEVVRSSLIANAIQEFTRAEQFALTLFDPDSARSANFCA